MAVTGPTKVATWGGGHRESLSSDPASPSGGPEGHIPGQGRTGFQDVSYEGGTEVSGLGCEPLALRFRDSPQVWLCFKERPEPAP